jgi:hypothetical protein
MSTNAYVFIIGACLGMTTAFVIDYILDREFRKDDEYETKFLYELIQVQNNELLKYVQASQTDELMKRASKTDEE